MSSPIPALRTCEYPTFPVFSLYVSSHSDYRIASACFLLCIGSNTPSVMLSTWYSNNSISENKRVVLTGVMVGIANASGLISGNIFQVRFPSAPSPLNDRKRRGAEECLG